MKPGFYIYQIGFQISPIILVNGIASGIPGNMLPLIAITQAANFTLGLLNGTSPLDINQFFGHFSVIPGGTLIDSEPATYPFANAAVAANSMISNPLEVSLLMETPQNQPGSMIAHLATMTALKLALDQHQQQGGTYIVATPAQIYTNMLLRRLQDVSRPNASKPQSAFQWSFVRPLLALDQITQTMNGVMARASAGLPQ